jgi:hypothetical protein
MTVKQLDRPALDVAGALGTDPVVDRVVLGSGQQGASMSAQVTMSGGSGGRGRSADAGVLARVDRGLLDRLPADASVADLLAARQAALTA